MTDQPPDLRRSMRILRQNLIALGLIALLGLIAGGGYTALNPPIYSSIALVVLPVNVNDISSQAVIATSGPVLASALREPGLAMSSQALRSSIRVTSLAPYLLSITGEGKTVAQAEHIADAVANSYVADASFANRPGGVQARVLDSATNATGTRPLIRIVITGCVGVLAGTLVGAVSLLLIRRNDQRMQTRDQIADAMGVPVLASVPVRHPKNAAGWGRLLEGYQASAAHGLQLRNALHSLRLADATAGGCSLTVLSLPSDRRARALGPQLAVFAASLGIPTALILGPQDHANTTDDLRAACATWSTSPRSSSQLHVMGADHDESRGQSDAMLRVVVAVIDGLTPEVTDMMRTSITVLAVTSGAATAEQLALVSARTATDGRSIAGILVADPDRADETTGRIPQLARLAQRRLPTRMTGLLWEVR